MVDGIPIPAEKLWRAVNVLADVAEIPPELKPEMQVDEMDDGGKDTSPFVTFNPFAKVGVEFTVRVLPPPGVPKIALPEQDNVASDSVPCTMMLLLNVWV